MKILFCDIDGCLNFARHRIRFGFNSVCADCINPLFYIIQRTGAKIIISSSWRTEFVLLDDFRQSFQLVMEQAGVSKTVVKGIVDAIIDMTLDFNKLDREKEIIEWIESNKFIGKFAILDDDKELFPELKLADHIFWCSDDSVGLTWDIADRIIKHLK